MAVKVIIIGGGFGGLKAALALAKADVDLIVIDKTNHHLFQPLLYQVATAAISTNTIAAPLRDVLRKQNNTTVIMGEVVSIDKHKKNIRLLSGDFLPYDYLVIAVGAINSYFGHNEWKAFAHGLKTLDDAVKIREHILFQFELAERCETLEAAKKHLRFAVVGGGPTGVEMAGAIAEIARTAMLKYFKKIHPENAEVYLIEGADRILLSYPEKLSEQAKKDLEKLNVKVLLNSKVTDITSGGIYIQDIFIETRNIIWTAGNVAMPLLKTLEIPLDPQKRVMVERDLSIAGFPELFVIGDAACAIDESGKNLPGVAPVAMQQGKYVANIIAKKIPKEMRKPFKYFDKGSMATIGKAKAVVVFGKFSFSGLFAWLVWSLIHIAFLINFRNRFIVMIEWIFLYFTGRRNATTIIRSIDQIKKEKI